VITIRINGTRASRQGAAQSLTAAQGVRVVTIVPPETPVQVTRVRESEDRRAITDVLFRVAVGIDLADAELLATTVTGDVVLDLGPATRKIGLDFPVVEGSQRAIRTCLQAVGYLDTSHSITNMRVSLNGDTATADCYVMAQHFLPGDGLRSDRTVHALEMNRWRAALLRTAEGWRIRRLDVDNAWFEGDPAILVRGAGSPWAACPG
jgi:hypothetical protein